jgi:hypothetical protein
LLDDERGQHGEPPGIPQGGGERGARGLVGLGFQSSNRRTGVKILRLARSDDVLGSPGSWSHP